MKRVLLIALLLGISAPLLSYSQDNSNFDYAVIDKQIKQFAALKIHDTDDLERISSDLIQILMSSDRNDQTRWYLQSAIHSINEIAKIMEHEALLIKIGLNYVKGDEKLLFYKSILKSRLEQYKQEINSSLEMLMNTSRLVTDGTALNMITEAEEISRSTVESHDRYIELLRSIEMEALPNR